MRVALPILEDSSLIFAVRLGPELAARGLEPLYIHVQEEHIDGSKLSERQIAESLGPLGLDATLPEDEFMRDGVLASFDAVVVSRVFEAMRARLRTESFRRRRDRPRFAAFMAGIDFFPERGMRNRQWFDAVFLNSPKDRDAFRKITPRGDDQHISWGHPYFQAPSRHRPLAEDGAIYFFAQAISPRTLTARLHVLQTLIALARLHPQRRVVLKLRHLPEENQKHVHRELFSYPWLLERMTPAAPANFGFEIGPIAQSLDRAGLALTCTSTAAADAISAGVPTAIYLDYPEAYHDRLVEPMRALFADSGLITPLAPLLRCASPPPPDPAWLRRHFRGPEVFDELVSALNAARLPSPTAAL